MKSIVIAFIIMLTMNLCESKPIHRTGQIATEISDPGDNTPQGSRLLSRSKRHADGIFNQYRSASQDARSVNRLSSFLTPRMRHNLSRYPEIVKKCVAEKIESRRNRAITMRRLRRMTSLCLRKIVRISS